MSRGEDRTHARCLSREVVRRFEGDRLGFAFEALVTRAQPTAAAEDALKAFELGEADTAAVVDELLVLLDLCAGVKGGAAG